MLSGTKLQQLVIIGACLLFGGAFAVPTEAQVGLSTFVLDLSVSPGGTAGESFFVVNQSESPQSIVIEPVDWVPMGPGKQEYLSVGTLERSVVDWMYFSPAEATIEPGEAVQVQVELTAPSTAEGCFWSMLFVRILPPLDEGGESQGRVGMNVILGVAVYADAGGGDPQGRITGLSHQLVDSERQALFTVEFENTGITRLSPTGQIQIRDEVGDLVREIGLPQFVSLPGTRQQLQVPLTRLPFERPNVEAAEPVEKQPPLAPGTYLSIAIIDYGGDALVAAQLPFEIEGIPSE